ncbi:unnamed protein product [Brachionus calyciflorus]|uniref:Ig-like domain-containing protein n=1 Tax=Brachionus calyciflorus TaxID=104777 RepID=A0A813Q674_9BILA|nr:unnamed protein product [Brachionus calyciflorus]
MFNNLINIYCFLIIVLIKCLFCFQTNDFYPQIKPSLVTNITTSIGKTVFLNCTLNREADVLRFRAIKLTTNAIKLNPTWLKADVAYNQIGLASGYKNEKIIVTRKGIILDDYREKMRLITNSNNNDQVLKISDVTISDEGKYTCREFSTQIDRIFYLSVHSAIKDLNVKFHSDSKYFRETSDADFDSEKLQQNYGTSNTVSIRENDEFSITCSVESSKPAANLSIWLLKNSNHQQFETFKNENFIVDSVDSKKLEIYETHVSKNSDLTLKTISSSKYIPSRYDNRKHIACIAENNGLNEKWESKKILNVFYGPKCNKYQKMVYNTGINQSIELECHMTDANPPYLDFSWNFMNTQNPVQERSRSTGFISRINWTPKSESDFGEITCLASNGLDIGECKIRLELGGSPNPPYDCYHKENNKTIIIECKPGFDQGDPEVYFYLLKKKSNGVLVEYARKRDSCSFLISNFILEEHINEFYVYSSNRFGNNKDKSSKIVIENKDFLLRNSNKLENTSMEANKKLTIYTGLACLCLFMFCFMCCVFMKCKKENSTKMYRNPSYTPARNSQIYFQGDYKYNSQHSNYNSESNYLQKKDLYNEKENDSNEPSTLSSSDNENDGIYDNNSYKKSSSYSKLSLKKNAIRSPSLLKNIQDLDMSPKSKRKSTEKLKEIYNDSLIEETTETDSEVDFKKKKKSAHSDNENDDDEKLQIKNSNKKSSSNSNTLKSNSKSFNLLQEKVNIWYGNNSTNLINGLNDEDYSGISVDKPSLLYDNQPYKLTETNSFGRKKSTSQLSRKKSYDAYDNINNNYDKNETKKKSKDDGYDWEKNKLFANETISLDVDEDKLVGILV